MSDESADEIDNRLAPHLEYFADRSNLIFAYHFSVIEFMDDEDFVGESTDNDRAWSLKTIKHACMNASLMALRDLDDFFTPRTSKTRNDDLRASDFGMDETRQYLSSNERVWINKRIAHTTKHGAMTRGYRWEILELISKAVAQCDSFLEWIKNYYSIDHLNIWMTAAGMQAKTKAILKAIQDESARQAKISMGD